MHQLSRHSPASSFRAYAKLLLAAVTFALVVAVGAWSRPSQPPQAAGSATRVPVVSTTPTATSTQQIIIYVPYVQRNRFTVLTGCRPLDSSDAAIIADGILQRESDDLLVDAEQRRWLEQELEQVISLIRESFPAMEALNPVQPYAAGELLVGLKPPLKEVVRSILAGQRGAVVFETGYSAFDALNRRASLRGIELHRLYTLLCFGEHFNPPVGGAAYAELDEIEYADPNHVVGDGPDVDALQEGDTWYVVFRDAWGDCPAGCIHEELFFFTVAGSDVTRVPPKQATDDPRFKQLIELVRR